MFAPPKRSEQKAQTKGFYSKKKFCPRPFLKIFGKEKKRKKTKKGRKVFFA
jgi:hypothetical protein